jgi:PAS domain S-box-containing protein
MKLIDKKIPWLTSEAESQARGERFVAWLRVLFGLGILVIVGVYTTHIGERLLPAILGLGVVGLAWGLVSAAVLATLGRVRYHHGLSFASITMDVLLVATAQLVHLIADPLSFVTAPITSFYFLMIGLAALRKNRAMVIYAGLLAALCHLLLSTYVFGWLMPAWQNYSADPASRVGTSYLDEVVRALLMAAVAAIFGLVTEELRESERHYRGLFEHVPDGIVIASLEGRVLAVNQRLAFMLGLSPSEIVGKRLASFITFDSSAPRRRRESSITGEPPESGATLHRPDGRAVPLRTTSVLTTYLGHPCTELSVRDVTEQLRLERQLAQSQKMETVGRLAGGLAHDFNNILGGIIGAVSLAERNIGRLEPSVITSRLSAQITVIRDSAEQAKDVVDRLMSFSRSSTFEPVPVDLARVVSDVYAICRNTLGSIIQIETKLPDTPVVTLGDATSLSQALLNLCVNAKDAMPGGGTLSIRVEPRVVRMPVTDPKDTPPPKLTMWCVEVEDTGVGIPSDILEQIFDPFFTTKPVGEGTGLGLAMVYNIAVEHDGFVDVESRAGKGSRFRIYLPVARPSLLPQGSSDSELLMGTGHLLVVDDEDLVRSSTRGMLMELGYEVDEASNGEDALELVDAGKTYDLVLLDVVMPKLNGVETAKQLRIRQPNQPILMMSGYLGQEKDSTISSLAIDGFLKKPFTLAALGRKVSQTLRPSKYPPAKKSL